MAPLTVNEFMSFAVSRRELPRFTTRFNMPPRGEQLMFAICNKRRVETHRALLDTARTNEEKDRYALLYKAFMKSSLEYNNQDPDLFHRLLWPHLAAHVTIDVSDAFQHHVRTNHSQPRVRFEERDQQQMRLMDLFKAWLRRYDLKYDVERRDGWVALRLRRGDSDRFSVASTMRHDSDSFSTADTLRAD